VSSNNADGRSLTKSTAKVEYYHAKGYIWAIGQNARRTIYHPNMRIRHQWQRTLHYLVRVKHRAYIILHPPPVVTNHYFMWECIHGKEGAWNANTGNGYLGGLQMTPGWGGVSRPDLLSPTEQMNLAERVWASQGYSISWLRHQWPNTSWGCV
jgi:hypothetical protein